MSTRATYRIAGGFGNRQAKPTFYIHHDGYAEGAATYFNAMLIRLPTSKGGFAEAFVRANDGAELTASHEAHGDTEFQYDMDADGFLTVRASRYPAQGGKQWAGVWAGSVWAFVNQNSGLIECFDRWVEVEPRRWMNRAQAEAARDASRRYLESYSHEFPQMTGNIDSLARELAQREVWVAAVNAAEG